MIQLDRAAPLPIGDQLVEALRYQIASGKYLPSERLPSTRALGEQVGVSFHTVRKAYQRLAEDGLVSVQRGGGYVVVERAVLTRAERLERASTVVQDMLHKLVGLGLGDDELEYVVEEGVQFFQRPGRRRSLVFAAAYRELADSGAEQATGALQERVAPSVIGKLPDDMEAVIAPLPSLGQVRIARPDVDAVGVVLAYDDALLERVARLGTTDTLAVVTRWPDALRPLTTDLALRTGFDGRTRSISLESTRSAVQAICAEANVVLYTPQARRRVRPVLGEAGVQGAELAPALTAGSLARLREALAS